MSSQDLDVESLREELKTIKQRLVWLMENYPVTRDDRLKTINIYCNVFGRTPPESITRVQRIIHNQEKEKYPHIQPSEEIREMRRRRAEAMRIVTYEPEP